MYGKFVVLALLLMVLSEVTGNCDNNCSGHGTCNVDDVCTCYDNWGVGLSHDSGDCSDRICPYELAWVDTPDKTGKFHKYAECANRGICNREIGECQCFEGYEGKGCQRTSCPNDCSGHGTCEYIEDLFFGATFNDYQATYFESDPVTFSYRNWDHRKIRGCVCDATYGDVDCSKRLCPYGTDVLAVRDDLLISTKYHTQQLIFVASTSASTDLASKTFALTFKSKLNETFTTIPIVFDYTDMSDLVHDIQLALLNLPNRVVDGVTVIGSYNQGNTITINVTFTGHNVQGKQHLLVVEDYECGAGCTPRLDGLNLQTRYNSPASNTSMIVNADLNSYECGRRGKCDYSSGLCQCFTGYTGDNCDTLTTLT